MANKRAEEVQAWLTDYIASVTQVSRDEIRADQEFTSFGIDSATAVGLSTDLGDWLGMQIDPTLVYDYPTIEGVSEYVAAQLEAREKRTVVVATA